MTPEKEKALKDEAERRYPDDSFSGQMFYINIARKAYIAGATAEALRNESNWISVEKDLPEDSDFKNISFENGAVLSGSYWSEGELGWHDNHGELYYGVTHWQPLPAPPKK